MFFCCFRGRWAAADGTDSSLTDGSSTSEDGRRWQNCKHAAYDDLQSAKRKKHFRVWRLHFWSFLSNCFEQNVDQVDRRHRQRIKIKDTQVEILILAPYFTPPLSEMNFWATIFVIITQILQISGYRRPLAPLKCVPLLKNTKKHFKNQKSKTHLFSEMLLTLSSFSISHTLLQKSSTPGPTWSPQIPPQHGQRTHLREKGFGIWRAAPLHRGRWWWRQSMGGKRCGFFLKRLLGGQTNSYKSTQKCCV